MSYTDRTTASHLRSVFTRKPIRRICENIQKHPQCSSTKNNFQEEHMS